MISGRPLDGMLVVEFSQLIAGPCAGMILRSYGAEVIKVEPPGGDPGRSLQSAPAPGRYLTPTAVAYNQGKRSIVVDLKQPGGQDIARRLIERADVVTESSRAGAMEKLGLGPDDAARINPGVVYASVSAFGRSGPERLRGGVDMVIQAESGIMSVTGEAGGPPLKVGFQVVDVASGHVLAQAILAALLERARTGAGQAVEVALAEVAHHLQTSPFTEYLATGRVPQRAGNTPPQTAPADLFDTADGQIVMAGYLDPHWRALCRIVGMPELVDDPRFRSRLDRVMHRDQLFDLLQQVFLTRPTAAWTAELDAAGMPVGQVKSYDDIVASAQAVHRGVVSSVRGSDGSEHRTVRLPARFGGWTADTGGTAPIVGEHTRDVLGELGYDATTVANLAGDGVVEVGPEVIVG
jgi:crotonobetainyl-CoA:carnitine CoA-transferase CaiB-like acyl-CoA transferase